MTDLNLIIATDPNLIIAIEQMTEKLSSIKLDLLVITILMVFGIVSYCWGKATKK